MSLYHRSSCHLLHICLYWHNRPTRRQRALCVETTNAAVNQHHGNTQWQPPETASSVCLRLSQRISQRASDWCSTLLNQYLQQQIWLCENRRRCRFHEVLETRTSLLFFPTHSGINTVFFLHVIAEKSLSWSEFNISACQLLLWRPSGRIRHIKLFKL